MAGVSRFTPEEKAKIVLLGKPVLNPISIDLSGHDAVDRFVQE